MNYTTRRHQHIVLLLLLLSNKIALLKKDIVCSCVFIALSALIAVIYRNINKFDIRMDQLMLGIASGYLFRFIRTNEKRSTFIKKHSIIGQLMILFIILMAIASSSHVLKYFDSGLSDYDVGWNLIFVVGFFMSLLSVLVFIGLIINRLTANVSVGWTSLIATTVLIGGMIIMVIGVVGMYVGNIFMQVKGRPLYVVRQVLNEGEKE